MAKTPQRTPEEAERLRAEIEAEISRELDRAMRSFLRKVSREAIKAVENSPLELLTVTAAAGLPEPARPLDSLPTLGFIYSVWSTDVDKVVQAAVFKAFHKIYKSTTDGQITATSIDGLDTYLANVSDRLVRGLTPPLPEAAFDAIRAPLAEAAAEGWTKKQLAQRIAADMSWETNGPYWRKELATVDSAIDKILDAIGPPGNPAREAARLNDPAVQALRDRRNEYIKKLDAEKTYWEVRANRIARTESTGAMSFGTLQALEAEGWTHKIWVSANDSRTRPEHVAAGGQVAPVSGFFDVGGVSMQMPGDPMAPAEQVVNCRCTIIGTDDPLTVLP